MPASNPSIFWNYYCQNKAENTAIAICKSCRQVLKNQDLNHSTCYSFKEFNCFETTGEKSCRLKMLFDILITIKPT